MDRKTVLLLVASFGALFLWQFLVGVWFPPVPKPPGATNVVASVTNGLGTNATPPATNVTPTPATAVASTSNQLITLATNIPEQLEVMKWGDTIYTFTSRGGGLKQVQLERFPETVGCDRASGTNQFATLNDHARVAVLAMQAGEALGDNDFKLTRSSPNTLMAEKVLATGLRVVNQFDLGSNYQVSARQRIENTSAQNITLPPQQLSVGTATPMGPRDAMTEMGVFWFNGEKAEHIQQPAFEGGGGCMGIGKRAAKLDYNSGTNAIRWAAVHNQFFTIAVVPATNAIGSQFAVHRIDLPAPTAQDIAADSKIVRAPRGLEAMIDYP
ncbi:MAG TPA: YidC/Oxa1 family insertase periplasmic-domain containing protein, partial [Verrucomicrobiae bacterium]